jgi:hypothetical protein
MVNKMLNSLGYNIRDMSRYARAHDIKISEIPKDIVETFRTDKEGELMANRRFEFNWEFGRFQIRTVHDDTGKLRRNFPIEIIKYFDDKHSSCYVIAGWQRTDEGYELRFVGSRPMQDIEPEEISQIWRQIRAAQAMLDEYWKADEEYD